MKKSNYALIILITALFIYGCKKIENNNNDTSSIQDMIVPDGFAFETTEQLVLNVKMPPDIDFTDYRSMVNVYSDSIHKDGRLLASGTFDTDGSYSGTMLVPTSLEHIYIESPAGDTFAIIHENSMQIKEVNIDFGTNYNTLPIDSIYPEGNFFSNSDFLTLGTGTSRNIDNLIGNGDFSQNDFGVINNVGNFTPADGRTYFSDGYLGNQVMTWFNEDGNQFIGTTMSQKSQYAASQTFEVNPGDLITFSCDVRADQANGMHSHYWILPRRANGNIGGRAQLRYSFPAYTWTKKTVMMTMPPWAAYATIAVIGGDWTPWGRLLFDNFLVTGPIMDSDNDGVEDEFDDYPNDPTRAQDVFYPNEEDFATLLFEDNWPGKGDYDFNDMVVEYQFKEVLNANNELVEVFGTYRFMAAGAALTNGFGFEMELAPEKVSLVTGASKTENYTTIMSNGVEAGQQKATIIVTDNIFTQLPHPGGGVGVNTNQNAVYVEPAELLIHIELNQPVSLEEVGRPPYNPFMIIDMTRGREVHLPDFPPTSLANSELIGSEEDDSDPATGKYYMTSSNHPWALNIPVSFDYPLEKLSIDVAYLHFIEWAESGGESYDDWYMNKSGYINNSNIYKKPN